MNKTININHNVIDSEFERWVGREPTDEELTVWADWIRMTIENQIDYELVYRLATEEFNNDN